MKHGIPIVAMYNKNANFTGNFWESLFKGLYTQLNFSGVLKRSAYHVLKQMDKLKELIKFLNMCCVCM